MSVVVPNWKKCYAIKHQFTGASRVLVEAKHRYKLLLPGATCGEQSFRKGILDFFLFCALGFACDHVWCSLEAALRVAMVPASKSNELCPKNKGLRISRKCAEKEQCRKTNVLEWPIICNLVFNLQGCGITGCMLVMYNHQWRREIKLDSPMEPVNVCLLQTASSQLHDTGDKSQRAIYGSKNYSWDSVRKNLVGNLINEDKRVA